MKAFTYTLLALLLATTIHAEDDTLFKSYDGVDINNNTYLTINGRTEALNPILNSVQPEFDKEPRNYHFNINFKF